MSKEDYTIDPDSEKLHLHQHPTLHAPSPTVNKSASNTPRTAPQTARPPIQQECARSVTSEQSPKAHLQQHPKLHAPKQHPKLHAPRPSISQKRARAVASTSNSTQSSTCSKLHAS